MFMTCDNTGRDLKRAVLKCLPFSQGNQSFLSGCYQAPGLWQLQIFWNWNRFFFTYKLLNHNQVITLDFYLHFSVPSLIRSEVL